MKKIFWLVIFLCMVRECALSESGAPALLAPDSRSERVVPYVSFLWNKIEGAECYEIEFAEDADFKKISVSGRSEIARFVNLQPFPMGTSYWRVRGVNQNGTKSPWSRISSFSIVAPKQELKVLHGASSGEIQAVLKKAALTPGSRVAFEPGEYKLDSVSGQSGSVLGKVSHARDLILDGTGVKMQISNPQQGWLDLEKCERVWVNGFDIDYTTTPHSIAITRKVDIKSGMLTLAPAEGYPQLDAEHILKLMSWGCILDKKQKGRLKTASALGYAFRKRVVKNADDSFQVGLVNVKQCSDFSEGDPVIIFARNGGNILRCTEGKDYTVSNVSIHASPSGHLWAIRSSDFKILNCKIAPSGSGRWYAGNADGVHAQANRIGPWIEGCEFNSIGDDAIAFYNKGMVIKKYQDGIFLVDGAHVTLQAGDQARLFNPREGLFGASLTVKSIIPKGKDFEVTFRNSPDMEVVCGKTPEDDQDQFFDETNRNSLFMVRNNRFLNIRRYGTVVRSADGAIIGNSYESASTSAIAMLNEPKMWKNGSYTSRVIVMHNTISDCGFDQIGLREKASIEIKINCSSGKLASSKAHSEIIIRQNTFQKWWRSAIDLKCSTACVVSGNIFKEPNPSAMDNAVYAITLENTQDCHIANNEFAYQECEHTKGILDLKNDSLVIEGNRFKAP